MVVCKLALPSYLVEGEFTGFLADIYTDEENEPGKLNHLCRDSISEHAVQSGCCLMARLPGCTNHYHACVVLEVESLKEIPGFKHIIMLPLGKVFDGRENEILYVTSKLTEPFYYCAETNLILAQGKRLGVIENGNVQTIHGYPNPKYPFTNNFDSWKN